MLCISAVYAVMRCPSVCLSVTFVDHVKTNKHNLRNFSPSGSHTIPVFPYQTGWRYYDWNPPNGDVECRWGIGRNRDFGLIAGYRRLLDVQSAKNIYRRRSWVYETVGHSTHHWLSIDCWTCELRSDKNSYRRPCSVDRTIGDSPANVVCDGLQHGRIRRREENIKEFNCTQWYYLKPKQLLIKDCARRFVLKL